MGVENKFSEGVKKQLLNELENLTRGMDIPLIRQKDPYWLLQNADVNNPGHKNLDKIVRICKYIIAKETDG